MFSGILTEIWLSSICDILTWSNKVTSSFLLSYLLPKTASVSPVRGATEKRLRGASIIQNTLHI